MNYDKRKVEIINILHGSSKGISFIEFIERASGKKKILQTKNFYARYGVKDGI